MRHTTFAELEIDDLFVIPALKHALDTVPLRKISAAQAETVRNSWVIWTSIDVLISSTLRPDHIVYVNLGAPVKKIQPEEAR